MTRPGGWGRRSTADELALDVRQLVGAACASSAIGAGATSGPANGGLPAPAVMVVRWGTAAAAARLELAAGALVLSYDREGRPEEHRLDLVETMARPFGGRRWWARCPSCEERRALLYLATAGPRCRACAGLAYASTREDAFHRAVRRRDRARALLGAPPGCGPLPERPAGRWRSRWSRLAADAAGAAAAADALALVLIEERLRGGGDHLHPAPARRSQKRR